MMFGKMSDLGQARCSVIRHQEQTPQRSAPPHPRSPTRPPLPKPRERPRNVSDTQAGRAGFAGPLFPLKRTTPLNLKSEIRIPEARRKAGPGPARTTEKVRYGRRWNARAFGLRSSFGSRTSDFRLIRPNSPALAHITARSPARAGTGRWSPRWRSRDSRRSPGSP